MRLSIDRIKVTWAGADIEVNVVVMAIEAGVVDNTSNSHVSEQQPALFLSLPEGGLLDGLSIFHMAARSCPETVSDTLTPAQEYLPLPVDPDAYSYPDVSLHGRQSKQTFF
jgi:hypothetical protein